MLLVGPPLPVRPRMMGQTKNDTRVLQDGGCADLLVTLPRKNKYLLIHFSIALSPDGFHYDILSNCIYLISYPLPSLCPLNAKHTRLDCRPSHMLSQNRFRCVFPQFLQILKQYSHYTMTTSKPLPVHHPAYHSILYNPQCIVQYSTINSFFLASRSRI
jgi:hypothetical protein